MFYFYYCYKCYRNEGVKYMKQVKNSYEYDIEALNEYEYMRNLSNGSHYTIENSTSKPYMIPKVLKHIPIELWEKKHKIWLNT